MPTAIPVTGDDPPGATRSRHREFGRHAAWYLAAGGVTTALQAGLFLALRTPFGSYSANLLAIAATTLVNTEFHRRVTFAGTAAPAGRRYLQAALTFVFYAGYGSLVLLVLRSVVAEPTGTLETLVLVATSMLGGACRFFLLRLWVFARH
ncbi:Putative flippase GtrA (transmembrane translocase of bactoprenol-linked glucose) [Amycolatopsis marina]|uniref:Flippase GtrA (Transmembrane translocase of bactoprenol-linked glucose) n=1 Tax=Amycolatopsis marina TaxID=490629 RepID=A0A1I0WSS6_9PSEU|nr:GtrA family protein [Amycolatopsis marina]SFA91056.1 Putative flippase GtrA (transmembrane translocase of bactoprenol-linked glucose) [Amycolatopsis marina]